MFISAGDHEINPGANFLLNPNNVFRSDSNLFRKLTLSDASVDFRHAHAGDALHLRQLDESRRHLGPIFFGHGFPLWISLIPLFPRASRKSVSRAPLSATVALAAFRLSPPRTYRRIHIAGQVTHFVFGVLPGWLCVVSLVLMWGQGQFQSWHGIDYLFLALPGDSWVSRWRGS